MSKIKYDLALFQELNKEYESKPILPTPRSNAPAAVVSRGEISAQKLTDSYDLKGKRILEVGCGRGEVSYYLQKLSASEVVAVDIKEYKEWSDWPGNEVSFVRSDLTSEDYSSLGKFDFIYSMSVIEHVQHPHSMLKAIYDLLKEDGTAYLYFNLYRGPLASHRYREIFFPWPHILFEDEVFKEYYKSIGQHPKGASWVNRLSIADYFNYLSLIGFKVEKSWFWESQFDEEFYKRFEDKLSRYPRYDLTKNFIHLVLKRG